MGLFDKILKWCNTVSEDLSEYRERIDSLRKPAVKIEKGEDSSFSKIGGLPAIQGKFQWPIWKGNPLAFLCQIDFEEIPKAEFTSIFPDRGRLYFFYDQEQSTWGFNPKDKGSWKVIYLTETNKTTPLNAPTGLKSEFIYKEKNIKFSHILTYPDWQEECIQALNLNDVQSDEYFELAMPNFNNEPSHYLLGYSLPVQGTNMELDCQLASNGLYCGDSTGYNDPRAETLKLDKDEWILLLQLDTDDDTEMMWGDAGMLYFWIRKDDLRDKKFDNVWMILQCG